MMNITVYSFENETINGCDDKHNTKSSQQITREDNKSRGEKKKKYPKQQLKAIN